MQYGETILGFDNLVRLTMRQYQNPTLTKNGQINKLPIIIGGIPKKLLSYQPGTTATVTAKGSAHVLPPVNY